MKPLLVIVGTRPECIKMAPVVRELKRRFPVHVLHTGQHRDLWHGTGLEPDQCHPSEHWSHEDPTLAVHAVRFPEIPCSWVVVQGDTMSAMAGALYGWERGIPVYHVEAGVRSLDFNHPWPEEVFREAIDRLATAGACATEENLFLMAVNHSRVQCVVTGNPGVDACLERQRPVPLSQRLDHVMITLHRRESLGAPLREIVEGICAAARALPDLRFQWPLHPNPRIREAIPEELPSNLRIGPPLAYRTFLAKLATAQAVVTDSGGVQEDAATLGIPCAVAREVTDRSESVRGGWALLAGRTREGVRTSVMQCCSGHVRTDPSSVFGDGKASERIAAHLHAVIGALDTAAA